MHITFDPFWKTLKAREMTQYRLIHKYLISPGQLNRMRRNQNVSTYTIEQFCKILQCGINDIVEVVDDDNVPLPGSLPAIPVTGAKEQETSPDNETTGHRDSTP